MTDEAVNDAVDPTNTVFTERVLSLIKIILPDTKTAIESQEKDTTLVFSTFNHMKDCIGVFKINMDEGLPLGTGSRRGIYFCQIAATLTRQLDALILSYNLRGNNA